MNNLSFDGFDTKSITEMYNKPEPTAEPSPEPKTTVTSVTGGIVSEAVMDILNRRTELRPHITNTAYFTPSEFDKYDIGCEEGYYSDTPDNKKMASGCSVESWRENYVLGADGSPCKNMQSDWNATLRKLYMDYDVIKESGDAQAILNRKQSILDLCWNPEIPFTEANQIYAKSRFERKNDLVYTAYDLRHSTFNDELLFNEDSRTLKPLFIINTVPGRNMYLSNTASLTECVPFASRKPYVDLSKNVTDNAMIICTMVPGNMIDIYEERFHSNNLIPETIHDTNVNIMPNIHSVIQEFKSIAKIDSGKYFLLYYGPISDYNPDDSVSLVNAIKSTVRLDNAENLPVNEDAEFDERGTLIIYKSHSGGLDFGSEINHTAKLCKIYTQTGNIEGLKYEVAKLYFFYLWMDKEINKPNSKLDINEINNCKRICTNMFSQNLKKIIAKEPDFIFGDYYNKSVFGGAIKVTPDTMKYTIKAMIKLLFGTFKK